MANYIKHSKGPWKKHKYVRKEGEGEDAKYIYSEDSDDEKKEKDYGNPVTNAIRKNLPDSVNDVLDNISDSMEKGENLRKEKISTNNKPVGVTDRVASKVSVAATKKAIEFYSNRKKKQVKQDAFYGDYLSHSKGPWKKHKYIRKEGSGENAKYFYGADASGSNESGEKKPNPLAKKAWDILVKTPGGRTIDRIMAAQRAGYGLALATKKLIEHQRKQKEAELDRGPKYYRPKTDKEAKAASNSLMTRATNMNMENHDENSYSRSVKNKNDVKTKALKTLRKGINDARYVGRQISEAANAYNKSKKASEQEKLAEKRRKDAAKRRTSNKQKEKVSFLHSFTDASSEYLSHYGTKGQKWYHRYHQDYDVVPTRSGKVGTYYGKQYEENVSKAKNLETLVKETEKAKNRALINMNPFRVKSLMQEYSNARNKTQTSSLKLEAGKKLVRTTTAKDLESDSDNLYVLSEYDKEGRGYYENDWAAFLKNNSGATVRQNTYRVETAIVAPSYEDAKKMSLKLAKQDSKVYEKIGSQIAIQLLGGFESKNSSDVAKRYGISETEAKKLIKDYTKQYTEEVKKDEDFFVTGLYVAIPRDKTLMNDYKNMLYSEGYNAAFDYNSKNAGYAPLIVFDKSALKQTDSKTLRMDAFSGPHLSHYGTKGQKWYHRYHQDYDVVPTRSGKVGTYYGKEKISTENVKEGVRKIVSSLSGEAERIKNKKNEEIAKRKEIEAKKKEKPSREEILNDPGLLRKYRHDFHESEVTAAVNRMKRIDAENSYLETAAVKKKYGDIEGKLDTAEKNTKRLLRWYKMGKEMFTIFRELYTSFQN